MLCFPYIYDAFLNSSHKVDTFIHTWDNSRVIDLYNPIKIEIETNTQKELIDFFLNQIYIPRDIKLEGRVENNLLQFYSLKKSFDLIPDDYDIVIRCRFDVIMQNKFNLTKIIAEIVDNKYDIFCPDEVFNFGGYQDRIYIGNYKSMQIATSIIENINYLIQKLNRWHPESFLSQLITDNNIRIHQENIDHRLVREVSIITNWPENPYNFLNL